MKAQFVVRNESGLYLTQDGNYGFNPKTFMDYEDAAYAAYLHDGEARLYEKGEIVL